MKQGGKTGCPVVHPLVIPNLEHGEGSRGFDREFSHM